MKNTVFNRMSSKLLYSCLIEGVKRKDKELIQCVLEVIDYDQRIKFSEKAYKQEKTTVALKTAAELGVSRCMGSLDDDTTDFYLILGVVRINKKDYLISCPESELLFDDKEDVCWIPLEENFYEIKHENGEEVFENITDEEKIDMVFKKFQEEYPIYFYKE